MAPLGCQRSWHQDGAYGLTLSLVPLEEFSYVKVCDIYQRLYIRSFLSRETKGMVMSIQLRWYFAIATLVVCTAVLSKDGCGSYDRTYFRCGGWSMPVSDYYFFIQTAI